MYCVFGGAAVCLLGLLGVEEAGEM